jgi:hypothetical protein
VIAGATDRAKTAHAKGERHGSCGDVRTLDRQLQGVAIAAQDHVLATAGFD